MPANNGNLEFLGILLAESVGDEGGRANDVESRDAENLAGVEDASLLEHLDCDGYGAINRIGDNADEGGGAVFGNARDKVGNNIGIGLEEVYLRVSS